MLSLRNVTKRFGEVTALDDVGFDVRPSRMTGFVGANGAGKTTTMRIVFGVTRADSGTVTWQERPITLAERARFGYMPEERGLYPKMRILDQLVFLARLHGLERSAALPKATELMGRLGLGDRLTATLDSLSLGNQQRVQIAAALLHDPVLMVLDEPFSGLDPVAVDTLAAVLRERCRAGAPVLFSSHQLDLVERLCDSVGILARGRMVASGTVADLRRREAGRVLRVVVPDAGPGWAAPVPGVRVVSEQAGDTLLELGDGADDQAVLAAALRTGRVTHFAWRQATLVELFREAVADPVQRQVRQEVPA